MFYNIYSNSESYAFDVPVCAKKSFHFSLKWSSLLFVQTFTKRSLNYLVAVTQNLAKTGERFLRFEMEPCFSVRYVYLLVAPHFQFRFHVWWNCFSGKIQFNDRPLSNSFSVAVEEKFKKFLVFSLIQWNWSWWEILYSNCPRSESYSQEDF